MFVILVSHWTRKWPFLWGPRLRSLAAIKLTDVNGSFWSFGIVACGRKLRLHDLEGWCNGLLIIFFPTASFRKQPRANATSSVYIYIYVHIPPIYLFSFRSIYSCQVLLLDMLSEAFHNESVMESSAQMALMYSGWTCEYHSAGHDHKHTPPEPACFCSNQITSKHIMSDGQ